MGAGKPLVPAARHSATSSRSRGFSLLELVVVIVIISILIAVALNRLLPYIDEAERVGVLTMESQIKSMLLASAAKRIAGGKAASISELDRSNPILLMLDAPDNYVGELRGDDEASVPPRTWYFNLDSRRLVYRTGRRFAWSAAGQDTANPEFEVRVAFDDRNGNGHFEPGADELFGVRLQRQAGVEWLTGDASARP